MLHQNESLNRSFQLGPAESQAKTHNEVICLETREQQFGFLSSYYADVYASTFPLGGFFAGLVTAALTNNIVLVMLAFPLFYVAAWFAIMPKRPKNLSQAKGRLVKATIVKRGKDVVMCLPEGEFVIRRSWSQYYRPLEYLCREKDYETELCVYQDPKTDVPFLAFRDSDEFVYLEPPNEEANQAAGG